MSRQHPPVWWYCFASGLSAQAEVARKVPATVPPLPLSVVTHSQDFHFRKTIHGNVKIP